jgi:hypothetical protein
LSAAIQFDFKSPDYASVFRERSRRLLKLRAEPQLMAAVL